MRKVLLAFALGVVILALLSGCIGGKAGQVLPSRPIEISRGLADRAWNKIYTAQRQGSFSLSFTESELTSLLVFTLEERLKEHPLREPKVWIERDRIIFAATVVDLAPSPLNLVVEFQLYVKDGAVGVRFLKINVNRTSLPAVTLRTLSRIASETLAEAKLRLYIEEIRTETGVISIKGRITS